MIMLNDIYLEDCLCGMGKIPSNTIDVVIADPPYNIGKDFGNNKDNLSLHNYIAWSKSWLSECFRVLKPTGTIYIYGFSEILAHISTEIDINKQRWLICHYTNKNVPGFSFWQRSHEAIIVCWKDKPFFNFVLVREPYTESFLKNSAGKVRTGTKSRFGRTGKETVYNAHENGALPRDVFNISTLAGGASLKERFIFCKTCNKIVNPKDRHAHEYHELIIHPTQKPLALSSRLIRAAKPINADFTVLIPFAGSGSECIATLANGGHFIGFEINPDFVQLAKSQISLYLNQTEASNPQMSLL